MNSLEEESKKATDLLKGKTVEKVFRYRSAEFVVEFTDGTRLILDSAQGEIEVSIT